VARQAAGVGVGVGVGVGAGAGAEVAVAPPEVGMVDDDVPHTPW